MVSTHDRLKQTKENLVSLLKIHRKPSMKKKVNLEMGDSKNYLTKEVMLTKRLIVILAMPNF
ncbi:hypothetical protein GIB67_026075, partial [Kingdonia uniflora]